jgi:hypothetical protein
MHIHVLFSRTTWVGVLWHQMTAQVNAGVDGVPEARNPKVVEAPAPSAPFQDTLLTATVDPAMAGEPFQIWLMACPLPSVQRTVHPVIADVPAVTVTSPWKPPDQVLVVR